MYRCRDTKQIHTKLVVVDVGRRTDLAMKT